MLKQRLLTAVILLPLVLAALVYMPTRGIAIILAVLMLQGAWEWTRLSGLKCLPCRLFYIVSMAVLFWFIWSQNQAYWTVNQDRWSESIGLVALAWWIAALLWVFMPQVLSRANLANMLIKLAIGFLVLAPSWFAFLWLHALVLNGVYWLLFALFIIWIADSGAYFAGRAFGKHKLAPKVSPGKTWEGVAGAFLLVSVYALTAHFWMPEGSANTIKLLIICLLMVPVSILGDLLESLMKRQCGIKDSGTLLPGHGGILDRIDSLTSVMPLFMLFAVWLDIL